MRSITAGPTGFPEIPNTAAIPHTCVNVLSS
jgi:hypothetical protein